MSFYPSAVNERFNAPSCTGAADSANAEGTSASFVCGAFASVSLRIDAEHGSIGEARFRTNGCGFMVSAADVLCEWLRGRTFAALHGLPESELSAIVTDALAEFPAARTQCSAVVFEALRKAMSVYRASRIEEFQGETALICTCFGVSEATIVKAIGENHVTDVEDVTEICRAGSGCGSCRMLIRELIDSHTIEISGAEVVA